MLVESNNLSFGFFPKVGSGFVGPNFILKIFDFAKVVSLLLDDLVVLLDVGKTLVE